MTYIHPLFFVALIVLLGWLGRTGIKTLARSRSLSARRLLFVVGVVLFLALAGGASWTLVRAEQTGVIRCPGTRCGGSAALASEPTLYWSFFAFHARSEEHTSALQSLMRISYAVFCLKKKKKHTLTIK